SVALAITDAVHDSDYTLGGVTISGVPSGWSLRGDGAASITGGSWIVGSGDLAGLALVAPSSIEGETFTLSVTASESAVGPTGLLTAAATATFVVSVTDVAEAPTFSGPTVFSGSEEPGSTITLSGIAVSGDGDDILSAATVTGIPSGWTLYDGATALGAPGGTATFAAGDIGALRITAPDQGGETAVLTLTVTSREGSSGPSATGSETLTVTAFGVA